MTQHFTLDQVLEAVNWLNQERGIDEIVNLAQDKIFRNDITSENIEIFKSFVRDVTALYYLMKSKFSKIERDGGERYFEHLRAVVQNVLELPNPNIEKVLIALAHDSIEDTGKTYEWLAEDYGYKVALAVQSISKEDWKEYQMWDMTPSQAKEKRNAEYFGHMKTLDAMKALICELAETRWVSLQPWELEEITQNALDVKFADRIHNLSTQWDETGLATVRRKVDETKIYFLGIAQEVNMPAFDALQSLILQLEIRLFGAQKKVGVIVT